MSNPTFNMEIDGTEYKAEFAKIDEVHMGYEDHGVYTVHIGWLMGAAHHGTGHLMLTSRPEGEHVVNPRVAQFIVRMMELFGDWDTIKGRECLALYPVDGHCNEMALGLAPLPTRGGRPFIFAEVLNV
jgi:hypothetical protein